MGHHNQSKLLTMKECYGKKVLIVKKAQNQNDTHNLPDGKREQGHEVVLHGQGQV